MWHVLPILPGADAPGPVPMLRITVLFFRVMYLLVVPSPRVRMRRVCVVVRWLYAANARKWT